MAELKSDDPAVQAALSLEKQFASLIEDPAAQKILQAHQQLTEQITAAWKAIEGQMILSKTKSIKGDFGSITLVERQGFDVDQSQLPEEYTKVVPDLKKIGDRFKLANETPPGVTPKMTTYLRKTLKFLKG